MWKIFADEYLPGEEHSLSPWGRFKLRDSLADTNHETGEVSLRAQVTDNGTLRTLEAVAPGPIEAFITAFQGLGLDIKVLDYVEHAMETGESSRAAAYVEAEIAGQVLWGVGIDPSITRATYKAVISALNRAER